MPESKLSKIDSIFLVGTVNSKFITESYDTILWPILKQIDDANEWNQEFEIRLVYFAGDTPAQQMLGGFVESVGSATYPCRRCEIAKKNIPFVKKEGIVAHRTKKDVLKVANELGESRKSVLGIKRLSRLLEFQYFDPIVQTPFDPMHILLEGLCRTLVIFFVKLFLDLKRTTLSEMNSRIRNFDYGYSHIKNKIRDIKESDLAKGQLIITASQMRTFIELFPFILYDILDVNAAEYKYFLAYILFIN